MEASRPGSEPAPETSAGELAEDPDARPSELTSLASPERHGEREGKTPGTMRGGHDPRELARLSVEARRRGQPTHEDALTDADIEQALMRDVKRKPTPDAIRALTQWRAMMAQGGSGEDVAVGLEDWPDELLERVRARLVRMAERLEERAGGAPPRDRSPAFSEVSREPPKEPSTHDPDANGTPDGPEGASRYTDPPAPRAPLTHEGDS